MPRKSFLSQIKKIKDSVIHKKKSFPEESYDVTTAAVGTKASTNDIEGSKLMREENAALAPSSLEEDTVPDIQNQAVISDKDNSLNAILTKSISPSNLLCSPRQKENIANKRHDNDFPCHSCKSEASKQIEKCNQLDSFQANDKEFSVREAASSATNIQHLDMENLKKIKSKQTYNEILLDKMNDPHRPPQENDHKKEMNDHNYMSKIHKYQDKMLVNRVKDQPVASELIDGKKETAYDCDVREMYKHHGITIRKRGDTWNSIANGDAILVQCSHCNAYLQVGRKAKLVFCPRCHAVSPPVTNPLRDKSQRKVGSDNYFDSALARKMQEQEYDAALTKDSNELNKKARD